MHDKYKHVKQSNNRSMDERNKCKKYQMKSDKWNYAHKEPMNNLIGKWCKDQIKSIWKASNMWHMRWTREDQKISSIALSNPYVKHQS